jgi:hypothetical protein
VAVRALLRPRRRLIRRCLLRHDLAVYVLFLTGYGLYLLLFFRGGHYILFVYVFILPILMIVRFFRDRSAVRARQQAGIFQGPPPGYGPV